MKKFRSDLLWSIIALILLGGAIVCAILAPTLLAVIMLPLIVAVVFLILAIRKEKKAAKKKRKKYAFPWKPLLTIVGVLVTLAIVVLAIAFAAWWVIALLALAALVLLAIFATRRWLRITAIVIAAIILLSLILWGVLALLDRGGNSDSDTSDSGETVLVVDKLIVNGDLDVSGDSNVNGDLNVSGDSNVNGDLNVSGDSNVNGDLNVSGDANIGGDINVSEPEASEPEASEPEASEPEASEPEASEPHTHSYEEKVKQASCTAEGVRTYTCACGDSYTRAIAALGHNYTAKVVAPTTTAQGYTLHTCSRCGTSYKDSYTDMLPQPKNPTISVPTDYMVKGDTVIITLTDADVSDVVIKYVNPYNGSWVKGGASLKAIGGTQYQLIVEDNLWTMAVDLTIGLNGDLNYHVITLEPCYE